MQLTQEHNSSGAVTIALAEPKANSALVQTIRVEELDSTKDEPKLKGKNKCWAIVSAVIEDSCHLQLWNGTVELIELDYLQSLNYTPEECTQMQELATRLTRLLDHGTLEKAASVLLEHLGKIRRPYLTPLEERLLRLLEQESGVFR